MQVKLFQAPPLHQSMNLKGSHPRIISFESGSRRRKGSRDDSHEMSQRARKRVDWEIKAVMKALDALEAMDKATKRQRAREAMKRRQKEMEERSAKASGDLVWEEIRKPISEQKNHDELVKLILARYRAEQAAGYESGALQRIMGDVAHEFAHSERKTLDFLQPSSGGEATYAVAYTDMSQVLERLKMRWARQKFFPFDSSGPRIPPTVVSIDVDVAGLQVRESNAYWSDPSKGLKFDDIKRDALDRTSKLQGADKIYDLPSSLDSKTTYSFPFRSKAPRFAGQKGSKSIETLNSGSVSHGKSTTSLSTSSSEVIAPPSPEEKGHDSAEEDEEF